MNRRFEVQSKTKEDLYYIVQETRNKLECNCPAGLREINCNHKDIIRKFLNRQHQSLENLERIKEITNGL